MRALVAGWAERISVWGLAALLATLPFWRHRVLYHRPADPIFFEFRDITLYTNDLLWWGAIGAWLLSRLAAPAPGRLRFGPWFVTAPLLGFAVLAAAGAPLAVDRTYAVYQTLRLLLLVCLYLMLINVRLARGMVAFPLALGILLQAAVAIPQFLRGRSLGLGRLGEVTVDRAWPGASVVMAGDLRVLRAYGLAQHPNLLAGCLAAMLLVVAGYYLVRHGLTRLVLLFAIAAGAATLLLTFSRAAWLGLFLGACAMLVLLLWAVRRGQWQPDWRSIVILGVLLVSVLALFVATNWPLLQPRLGLTSQGTEIRSVEARRMQVPAALELIKMRPLLGVGLGNYPQALYKFASEMVEAYPVYLPVYSVPLLAAAELGVAGGALWLFLIVAPWVALWFRRRAVRITPWWSGIGGAMLALSVISAFDFYVWTSHQGRLLAWIILGLWAREWQGGRHPLPSASDGY